jgi:hypothetical protein
MQEAEEAVREQNVNLLVKLLVGVEVAAQRWILAKRTNALFFKRMDWDVSDERLSDLKCCWMIPLRTRSSFLISFPPVKAHCELCGVVTNSC